MTLLPGGGAGGEPEPTHREAGGCAENRPLAAERARGAGGGRESAALGVCTYYRMNRGGPREGFIPAETLVHR